MKLNVTTTNYIVFHKKYKTNFNRNNLSLTLYNKQITKSTNPTLLGIQLDKHLNFDDHFNNLRKQLSTKINLINHLSSRSYNINPQHLLTIYKAIILSKIQYSMLPFTVTSQTNQHKLQLIHLTKYMQPPQQFQSTFNKKRPLNPQISMAIQLQHHLIFFF